MARAAPLALDTFMSETFSTLETSLLSQKPPNLNKIMAVVANYPPKSLRRMLNSPIPPQVPKKNSPELGCSATFILWFKMSHVTDY